MDTIVFQAAVTAAMAQISTNGTSGAGNGTYSSYQGESEGRPRGCTYKDFSNYKPNSFYGSGGIITLTRWYEKTESVFEICACLEESKVKVTACTFAEGALSWWNNHVK